MGAGTASARPAFRPGRPTRRGESGVSLIEFALVSPIAFVLLFGIIVGGVVGMNYVQLTNAARDGARAAAVCGGSGRDDITLQVPTPVLPDGNPCTDVNLINYVQNRFQAIPACSGGVTCLDVTLPTGGSGDHLSQCSYTKTVEVSAGFDQPLYLPLIGHLLSNNGSGSTFTMAAKAEATCEI